MRPALIGPLPPELGGLVPGGVATHQAALAAGLARHVPVSLLATNTRLRGPRGWRRCQPAAFTLYQHYLPTTWAALCNPLYLRRVGPARAACYAARLAQLPRFGSRRETLGHLLWYRRFLEAAQPDLIHVQHPLDRLRYLRLLTTLERQWRRTPLVVTAHSFFGEHTDEVIFTLMAPNLQVADRVIAVSPHIAEQAIQLGVEPSRVRTIRSGVDTDHFQPRDHLAARRRLNVEPATPLVLFVGNLEPRKHVDVLLRALSIVRQAVPGAELAIVGTGQSAGADDQTQQLQQLSRDLGLAAAVRFVGRVSTDDLLAWYAAADAFALPSSSEAQGIVALEAMACGLPVVASAVGGLLGTIEDGQSGWLVPAGEVLPLARRLTDLLLDPELRGRIGAAARAQVMCTFTWPRAVAATLAVYHELLETCPT